MVVGVGGEDIGYEGKPGREMVRANRCEFSGCVMVVGAVGKE